jgi:hypothetical protein
MSDNPLPEPLENFLQAPPSLAPEPAIRDSLLKQSAAMLRQPRGWRHRLVGAGIAASILVAIAFAYFAVRLGNVGESPKKDLVERGNERPPLKETPKPQPPPEEPKPPAAVVQVNPVELEWTAFDAADDQQRVSLYFQAGDLYLEKQNDYESAVRCYSQALDYCKAHELAFNPNDNWLVMALKRDHRKEK